MEETSVTAIFMPGDSRFRVCTAMMPAGLMGSFTMMRSEKACSQRAWPDSAAASSHPMAWQSTGPGDASTTARSVFCMSGPAREISDGLVVTPSIAPHVRACWISRGSALSRNTCMACLLGIEEVLREHAQVGRDPLLVIGVSVGRERVECLTVDEASRAVAPTGISKEEMAEHFLRG